VKVSLLYPGITECGFNSLKGNEGSWMNHGLAMLSAALRQKGHQTGLIDLRRLTGWQEYRRVVRELDSRAVGITMMSVDYNAACKSARLLKELRPDVKVFVGGPHPSICSEELEPLGCFDCVVKGEGEITFPQLIEDLAEGRDPPPLVDGRRRQNLDDAPWADRDLFQCPEEPFVPFLDPPFVTLIAGRGCRYNCNYCQPAERLIFGRHVRRRSVQNVVDELRFLREKYAFRSFMIHDDCLTEDPEWVRDFCRKLAQGDIRTPFVAQSRADLICRHPDMMVALRDAGLRLIIIGFESGSDRVLKFLRKGCTRAKNLEAAGIVRALGIKIWANYMLGLPTETKEEVLETVSMLEEIRPYHCSPAFYTPHPGSDLFTMGQEMGIHLISDHASYRRNTYEPKIKGPDYEFLHQVLSRTVALAEDNRAASPAPGAAEAERISYRLRLQNRLKVALMRFPRLYRAVKHVRSRPLTRRVKSRN